MKEIILLCAVIGVALYIAGKDIASYQNIPFCDRQPGHGISYAEKNICLQQELLKELKK